MSVYRTYQLQISLLTSLQETVPKPAACIGESLLSMLDASMTVIYLYVDSIDVCFRYSRELSGRGDERDQSDERRLYIETASEMKQ